MIGRIDGNRPLVLQYALSADRLSVGTPMKPDCFPVRSQADSRRGFAGVAVDDLMIVREGQEDNGWQKARQSR